MEQSIQLMIEGIKCGSCVWLIESSLKKQDGVLEASVNMTTKTLSLTWVGNQSRVDEFIKLIETIGYKAVPLIESAVVESQKKTEKNLLKMIALSGVIWVQNMMISMGIWAGDISGELGINSRTFMNICAAILTIPILTYTSKDFFSSAWIAIKERKSHMDIPISIAIIVTLLVSVYGTFVGSEFVFFEAVSSLVFALLIGRYLDQKVRNRANEYARNLVLKKSLFVTVERNGNLELVNINSVSVGEIIYVAAGERIPLDGVVASGESEIDNSIITGESNPKKILLGDKVFAGSINLQNPIKITVESDEDNTILAEIKKLIEKSENQRSKYKTLAGKVAKAYTPVVLVLSLITIMIWISLGSISEAILKGVSVLVITCPCAMGLAVPVVHVVATSNLMKRGVFIKSQDALERLSEIKSVALDKTGVLTYGRPKILNDIPDNIKAILKSLAVHSKHHLCLAIVDELNDAEVVEVSDISEEKGFGISCTWNGKKLMIGRPGWCGVKTREEKSDEHILSTWFVVKNQEIIDFSIELKFSDEIRTEAIDFIKQLKKLVGNDISIISGDSKDNVRKVANILGITGFNGGLTPQEKYEFVSEKDLVLMVGDGLNDAAAMTQAHCSASPSNIIELSQNQSSIVFQNSLIDIIDAIKAAKKSTLVCKENIIISIVYNIISIPVAMLGYASPLVAAVFMGLSSVFVVLNTLIQMRK
jgi:Cu2+-exporting ATPase